MIKQESQVSQSTSQDQAPDRPAARARRTWLVDPTAVVAGLLLLARLAVVLGAPRALPTQLASWITFLGVFIMPGFLLADLVAGRFAFDWLERLALAFPLGIVVMAVPGMIALMQHWTVDQLVTGWMAAVSAVMLAWLAGTAVMQRGGRGRSAQPDGWTRDELALLGLIALAFVLILPALTLYKIDGDAYAVNSFAADALAGLPLNGAEPLFGTELGPGVRMVFNQSLPMTYLWSHLSGIDPIALTAVASRPMIALWVILAAYALGKSAGIGYLGSTDGRRMGLLVAAIQLLVYLVSPFLRGDNVSIFFFERTTADKFMVPVTMLPVAFALALHVARTGRRSVWLAGALVAVAVSTIHPLIAAMAALGLGAFGGFHLLLNLRSGQAVRRSLAVWAFIVVVMFLPVVQLVLARGEAPLAPSYPATLEGWPIAQKLIPALPYLYVPGLDTYGPLPNLARLDASAANTASDPFLLWRFAVNMDRRRLILFDLNRYISDPNLILEPPYLLAILLLPLLFWRIRSNLGAQLAVSTTLAVLFVMFNPLLTPLIGSLVMPWILWRFVWLLPYALIFGLVLYRLLHWAVGRLPQQTAAQRAQRLRYAPLAVVAIVGLLASPAIAGNLRTLDERAFFASSFPTPDGILDRLNRETIAAGSATVLADQDLSVTIPAYVARANIVAHRVPTTSEIFPADRQDEALQRLIDQNRFFRSRYLTAETVDILDRYAVRYVVVPSGSNLDVQLRLAPEWFDWLVDDQAYSLYAVHTQPEANFAVEANTAMGQRLWSAAARFYRAELQRDPDNLLARAGLAEIAHVQGRFGEAVAILQDALERAASAPASLPALHYRLGQLYAEQGEIDKSIEHFQLAQDAAPNVGRFHVAMGDACLSAGRTGCAEEQYIAAVDRESLPDPIARRIALADLWRQRGQGDRALALYEEAVELQPNLQNRLMLALAYQETARYDQAEALLAVVRGEHPSSTEVLELTAAVNSARGEYGEAADLYRRAIRLLDLQGMESTDTRLALAQTLLAAGELDAARAELDLVLKLEPASANGYRLLGELHDSRHTAGDAIEAYLEAFRLDPAQVGLYLALSDHLRQQGGRQDQILDLLQAAIRANPDEATLALALGDQLQRRGDTDAAIDAYQSALDMFELYAALPGLNQSVREASRAYAYTRLAGVSEDKGELEAAMNYYSAAVAAAPNLPWPYVLYGDAMRRRNQMDAAEGAYHRAMENDASYVDAYVRLADLMYARGDTAQALALQEQALQNAVSQSGPRQPGKAVPGLSKLYPQDLGDDKNLASDETTTGEVELSEQLAQVPVDLADQRSDGDELANTLRLLARLYQANGQTDRAFQLYADAIRRGREEGWYDAVIAQYHKGVGDLYLAEDQPELAADAYRKAVELDDWWPQARLGLARALTDLDDMAGALAQLRRAVEIAPGYVEVQVALADALERQGESAEALRIYEATAQEHAGNSQATLALARAWRDHSQHQAAEQGFRSTIATNPGDADAYVGLAALFIDQARYDEAANLLKTAEGVDQRNANIYLQLGVLEQRIGNPERALLHYRQAADAGGQSIGVILIDLLQQYASYEASLDYIQDGLAATPGDVELLLRLARLQRATGQYSAVMATLLEAARLDLHDSRLSAELGELYVAQGRPQAALAAYRQTISADPEETAYYVRLAELWQAQGESEQALAVLQSGVRRAQRPAALYAAMVDILLQRGEREKALQVLEQSMGELGEDVQLLLAMGRYREGQELEEAEAWYNDLLVSRPDDAALHAAMGSLYLRLDRPEEAIAALQRAIELQPTNVNHFMALAGTLQAAERADEAADVYLQALVLEPALAEAYTALGELYWQGGRQDEARQTFEQGMAAAPTAGELVVRFAAFLMEQGEQEAADALLQSLDQVSPTAASLVARAGVYSDLRQREKAMADLQTALRKEPGSLDALIALGDLYREMGDVRKARDVYQEATQLLPGVPLGRLRLSALAR